ncbi:MAG TPA: hypothetical protein VIG49_09055 [Acetobacteraceae bacterium]
MADHQPDGFRPMTARRSINPKRRLAPADRLSQVERIALADRLTYVGSGHHKRHPGDYGFLPPVSPRPWKSLCDGKRVILKDEAASLFREGLLKGMFSEPAEDGVPKWVWSVDVDHEVYEAKIDTHGYHGYRLEEDDDFRSLVLKEWSRR